MSELATRTTYSENEYQCDILVIGSGAGGAVAAAELARAGRKVIILEEGLYYGTNDFSQAPSTMIPKLYRNNGAVPFLGSPLVGYSEARCVGGGTVVNGGIFARLPEDVRQEWEIQGLALFQRARYESAQAEVELRIGAQQDAIAPGNLDSQLLVDTAQKLGLPYEFSLRTMKDCKNSNRCPVGCPTGAKQSVAFNYLQDAVQAGAEIFAGLRCTRIHHSQNSATAITAVTAQKKSVTIKFQHIFMAAGVTQTPYLLRKSGLSKRAGQKILYHTPLKMIAEFDFPLHAQLGSSSKTVLEGQGFKIASSNFRPEYVALSLYPHGAAVLDEAMAKLEYMGIFMALVRSFSSAKLRTTLLGQPLITNHFDSRDEALIRCALVRTCEVLFAAGARKLYLPVKGTRPVSSIEECNSELRDFKPQQLEILTVHGMGSCSMGTSDKEAVVDPTGKLWGKKNIYVCDASVLPGTTGCGPQATIMATALLIARNFLHAAT